MTRLETVVNIGVCILATVVIGTNLYDRFVPRKPVSTVAERLMNKPLLVPASLATGSKGTITVFVSKNCPYCTESMNFYQRLAKSRPTSCDLKFVALGPMERETPVEIQGYLLEHYVTMDGVGVVSFMDVGITGTPTLVVRDSTKLVRGVWTGRLSESKEDEVIRTVKTFCQT